VVVIVALMMMDVALLMIVFAASLSSIRGTRSIHPAYRKDGRPKLAERHSKQ